MKKYASKGLVDIVSTAGSMVLFLLFAVCMLIMVSAAASTYARITRSYEQTFSSSAALRYVTNKLRSADSAEILDGGSGVAVTDGGIVCVIYAGSDGIYERSAAAGAPALMQGGSRIFEGASVAITEADGLYTVTVTRGGESRSVFVRKGDCAG